LALLDGSDQATVICYCLPLWLSPWWSRPWACLFRYSSPRMTCGTGWCSCWISRNRSGDL